jgi:YVTN family beta-propeller protein
VFQDARNPIPLPNFSGQIVLSPLGGVAYIPNRESSSNSDIVDNLLLVDLNEAASSFGQVERFEVGDNPFGVACCDSSELGYLVNQDGIVMSFDLSNPAARSSLSLEVTLGAGVFQGKNSTGIAVNDDQIFVTTPTGNIYVIDQADFGVDYVLTGAGVAQGIAVGATGSADPADDDPTLYIVDATSSAPVLIVVPLSSIPVLASADPLSEVVISTIERTQVSLGSGPHEIVLFNGRAYVSNLNDDTVSVINLTSFSVEATIAVGDEPFGMAAFLGIDGTNYLYVTNMEDNSISVINIDTNSLVTTFTQ